MSTMMASTPTVWKDGATELVLAEHRPGVTFVNADLIAAELWPEDPLPHGHQAAEAAERARDVLLAQGEPFIAETVASHHSKVDLIRRARDAGYHVHLVVIAVPEELSVARVAARVVDGGHDVPEEKVRARWQRLWPHVVEMIELASSAEVFDNSGPGPITIATFVDGDAIGRPRWPAWGPEPLTRRWPGRDEPAPD